MPFPQIQRGLRRIPTGRRNWWFAWTELGAERIGEAACPAIDPRTATATGGGGRRSRAMAAPSGGAGIDRNALGARRLSMAGTVKAVNDRTAQEEPPLGCAPESRADARRPDDTRGGRTRRPSSTRMPLASSRSDTARGGDGRPRDEPRCCRDSVVLARRPSNRSRRIASPPRFPPH